MLHAYSMLLMKVLVEVVRGVSMTYAMTVGKVEARASRRMLPEADQTKTSIWPGVSRRMWEMGFVGGRDPASVGVAGGGLVEDGGGGGGGEVRFSSSEMIWSTLVAKRLREVRMPPLGPSRYCDMTSL